MANEFTARVAGISVELGMSVQNKSGIWCKPTVKMDLNIDGGTNPQQREAIIKQAFDEVCDNIEKTISEIAFNTGLENEGLYIFLPTFLEDLRDNYDNKDPEFDEILRMIKTCRLLIIDDIGAERVTDWVRERMVSIINTRVSNNLTTIYTSNLSPEELRSELGDRIASRVLGSSQVVEITSGDRRGL